MFISAAVGVVARTARGLLSLWFAASAGCRHVRDRRLRLLLLWLIQTTIDDVFFFELK